ncbi:MAG: hypothetical protein HY050_03580 [Actinobacteria bacterium]|nr:hypothetical protein [Actinomycetota bacterium]
MIKDIQPQLNRTVCPPPLAGLTIPRAAPAKSGWIDNPHVHVLIKDATDRDRSATLHFTSPTPSAVGREIPASVGISVFTNG